MLSKLLKYDIKSILKLLVIFYSLSVLFAIFTRVFLNIQNSLIMNIIGEICQGAMFSMMISAIINNLMRMWVRFKQNLYGDESYLTHTLPVTKASIYLSKIICSVITLTISVAVAVLDLFIAYYSKANMTALKNLVSTIANSYDVSIAFLIFLLVFVILLQIVNALQCGFTGMILGHRKNNAKTGFSVFFGFVTYMASQIVIVLLVFLVAVFNKDFMNLFVTNEMVSISVLKSALYLSIIGYVFVCVLLCFVNIKLFKKGVNVD